MVDPVACQPPAPDTVFHLTSTAWTAIGSIVSGVSVIALVAFNWRYLRLTHKLSDSAAEQASIARDSLKALQGQIEATSAGERHAAEAVLREVIHRVKLAQVTFRDDLRTDQNPIAIIPPDWNVVVAYVSRNLPDLSPQISDASQGLHNVETALNQALVTPINVRRPGGSVQVQFDSLATNLDNLMTRLKTILAGFSA